MIQKSNKTKNVYIVDYDRMNRARLAQFLRLHKFTVHPCSTGAEFVASSSYLMPGCILLDASPSVSNEFEVITSSARHRACFPIVAIIDCGIVAAAVSAMQAGAIDVVEKPIDPALLLRALTRVFSSLDEQVSDDARRVAANARLGSLTGRERDVLRGLVAGRSNKLLAHDIGISVRTVEMHRARMMERLGVRTLADALRVAFNGTGQIDGALVRRVA